MELPLVASCQLDADGQHRQAERYRRAGEGAVVIERTARRLVVELAPEGAEAVPGLIEVESQCCPFFELAWDPGARGFSIAVSENRHEPALTAIESALGI